jgi:hypothetical protein
LPFAQPHARASAAVLLDEYYAGGLWGARRTAKSLAAVMEVSFAAAALHVYLAAIIGDTAQHIPGGTLDRRYLDNLFQDLSADAVGAMRNAAEEMREDENWRAK